MNRRQVKNRGVTLVELMVALAVLAMLMTAVIMLMSNNTVIYKKTKADISVQTSAQETYGAIQDSIMQAKSIELKGYTDTDATIRTYKKKSTITPGSADEGFDTLMDVAGGTTTYKTIYPTQLTINYSVENSDDINNLNCTVTYYFHRYSDPESGHAKCNLYVTRTYDTLSSKEDDVWPVSMNSGWTPAKGTASTKADRDKFAQWLYTSAMTEAKFHVDYTTQSFDVILDFWDRGQKYNTSGLVSCRNSYIMKDMRSRTAAEVSITETTGGEGEEGSGESGD